jgi:hypothetical protein
MRPRRRAAIVALVALGAAGAALVVARGARRVIGDVERWCGRQILAIANDHLGPRLSFARLRYVPPRSVLVEEVALRAGDTTIAEAASALIGLARVPREGEPIVFESVVLERPVVRLVERDGGLVGFEGFVRPGMGRALPDGGSTRLSDVLAIETLEIRRGEVQYSAAGFTMGLSPLTFELVHSAQGDSPGAYGFDASLELEPLARLEVRGALDIDEALLEVASARLVTSLDPARYAMFPPRVQQYLEAHQIVGDLEAGAAGRLAPREPGGTRLDLTLRLERSSITFGEYVLPLRRLRASGTLGGGTLEVPQISIEALGGTAEARIRVERGGAFEAGASGRGIRLEQTFRAAAGSPRYSGRMDFGATASGVAASLPQTLRGAGDVSVAEGNLGRVQVLRQVIETDGAAPVPGGKDRGSVRFELGARGVALSDLHVIRGTMGYRGEGTIGYDGVLALRFSAGYLERLDGVLEAPGRFLSALTGKIVSYRVAGTIREPQVSVVPLGIGAARP